MLKLWALRFTVARGWQWKLERDVSADTADAWLAVFKGDEPTVEFTVSVKRPAQARVARA